MFVPTTYDPQELRLLHLLSRRYPTISDVHTEIINLNAILALPKGTDHYISDIHGAYEQFDHILRHASGAIRRKIGQAFGIELPRQQQIELAMLIYYPEKKLRQVLSTLSDPHDWMTTTIAQLVRIVRSSAQKYTRSKVRKRLDPHLAYILEELLDEGQVDHLQKDRYYRSIVSTIIELGEGENAIITLASLIQNLVVDRLYILGDIYDRGPAAEKVMDRLISYHYVSIQWGNHDVIWMAAAAGGAGERAVRPALHRLDPRIVSRHRPGGLSGHGRPVAGEATARGREPRGLRQALVSGKMEAGMPVLNPAQSGGADLRRTEGAP